MLHRDNSPPHGTRVQLAAGTTSKGQEIRCKPSGSAPLFATGSEPSACLVKEQLCALRRRCCHCLPEASGQSGPSSHVHEQKHAPYTSRAVGLVHPRRGFGRTCASGAPCVHARYRASTSRHQRCAVILPHRHKVQPPDTGACTVQSIPVHQMCNTAPKAKSSPIRSPSVINSSLIAH